MELGAAVCLICFEATEKHILLPSVAPAKIFSNCNTYLHSIISKDTLKDIQINKGNQLRLCKSCFESGLELTQLSEQLTTIQKDISDLTVTFSMAVFHRRSQVYSLNQQKNNSQSLNESPIIEFNEACLPPNLFTVKNVYQNIHKESNHEIIISNLYPGTDMANVKCESSDSDIPFDNLSENGQLSHTNDDAEIQYNKQVIDKNLKKSTLVKRSNSNITSRIGIVELTCGNDSEKSGTHLTKSELLKSVKMPNIILERINIESPEVDASVLNSHQTEREPPKTILEETYDTDTDEFTVPAYSPIISECENHSSSRNIHRRTHRGDRRYEEKLACESNQSPTPEYETTHTGIQPFPCSFCETGFTSLSALRIHKRIVHARKRIHMGVEKLYKCSYCEKSFKRNRLKEHERTHTGEKPFQCSFCGKKFISSGARKHHEDIHSSEKRFQCSFCEKKFIASGARKRHEYTHLSLSEKPFQCSFCGKRVAQLSHLRYHEQTHTGVKPFKCLFCKKCFTSKSGMKGHERSHTGIKPYKCSFCEDRFISSSSRIRHERTHATEKLIKCSFCEVTFSQDEDRIIHEKMHSKEDKTVNENPIVGI